MKEELIVVKQLPIIEENLKKISEEIDKRVELANSLICTEETVKEVKKTRAEISKQFKELETTRKDVKDMIMKPYNEFDEVYKKYISDKFKNADSTLKNKIDTVENELKNKKEEEIKKFFNEYAENKEIDFVSYKQANINVTLSASMKSLKEQAALFIDRIADDINLINTQLYVDEMMIEYKKDLNVSKAITEVNNRHIELKKVQQEKESKKEQKLTDESMLNKIDECLKAPKIEKAEEILELTFKVRGTREKLKQLKEFLNNGGYDYE